MGQCGGGEEGEEGAQGDAAAHGATAAEGLPGLPRAEADGGQEEPSQRGQEAMARVVVSDIHAVERTRECDGITQVEWPPLVCPCGVARWRSVPRL